MSKLIVTERQLLETGFRQVYTPAEAEPLPPSTSQLAGLKKGVHVTPKQVRVRRHPLPPLPALSEAELIRALRIKGIGRPSTYAGMVATLLERQYAVRLEGGKLRSTARGRAVCDFLEENFPALCAYDFTAQMEASLDALAQGQENYRETVQRFWNALPPVLKKGK